jgi:hypothetical protein
MRLQSGRRARDVALLALLLGLEMLCGHPQAAWLTQVGLVAFLVGRRVSRPVLQAIVHLGVDLSLAGGALALGLSLAAVALLPLAELAGQGNRPAASVAFAAALSEPSYGWATLIVPIELPYFGFQANGQLYAGLVPLIAGICGLTFVRDRNVRGLLALALFAGLLAAGEQTPVFRLFYRAVPGVGWFRIHARATVLVTTAFVLGAGLFFSRTVSRRMAMGAGVLALAALAGSAAFCLVWPGYGAAAVGMALQRGLVAAVAGLLVVAWIIEGSSGQTRRGRVVAGLLILATAMDLGFAVYALKQDNHETPPLEGEALVQRALESQSMLQPGIAPPRVFIPNFRENAGMVRGWSGPYGYSALAPGRVWKYMHNVLSVPVPLTANTFPSRALAAFGPFPYNSMALVIGANARTRHLALNPSPDPRAYVASSVRLVHDDDEATALMRAQHDFHHVALVEQPLVLPEHGATDGRARITRFAPERISIAVESPAPALLVLAEPWYPGWEARVNGSVVPCIPANAWMRAVQVPAGDSQVEMTFHSTYLLPGGLISLVSLAAILWMLIRRRAAPAA